MTQHLIIIRGPPGIGKSTIAKGLAKKLNGIVSVIDVDVLRWDFIPKRTKSFNDHNLVYKNLFDLVKNSLNENLNVIIEGVLAGKDNKGKSRIDQYNKFIKKNIKVTKIFLKGYKSIQYKRLESRKKIMIAKTTIKDYNEWSNLSLKSITKDDIIIDATKKSEDEIINYIISLIKK